MTTTTHTIVAIAALTTTIVAMPIGLLCPLLDVIGLNRLSALVAVPLANGLSIAADHKYYANPTEGNMDLAIEAHLLLREAEAASK